MVKTKWLISIILLFASWAAVPVIASDSTTAEIPQVPTPGFITMVDLGAHKCIPCKMMAPIIEELKKEFVGRASIIFIDVWEHKEQASRFGVRAIPTQIFYDKMGNEAGRHVGFMDKKSIIEALEKLGVSKRDDQ